MILQNKGIQTEKFYLPPFELKAGEIVVIYLFNREDSYEAEMFLKDIFCGKMKNENVQIHTKMTFVEHFIESEIRRIFCPVTVGGYLKKNANLNNFYSIKIYETEWINKKTKVNKLPGNPRRLLSLFAALSNANNIVFDLIAQDRQGRQEAFKIVQNEVEKGGSAILLDSFDDMKNDCTKYIEIQWTKQ